MKRGLVPGLAAVVAFSLTLPVTRVAVMNTTVMNVFWIRMALAVCAALCLLVLTRATLPRREHLRPLVFVCIGVVFGFPLFTALAMQTEAAAHGGVVLGVLPLVTAVAGSLLSNERPSGGFWVVAIIGCVLVVAYSVLSGGGVVSIGDLYLVAAVLLASVGYTQGAVLSRTLPAADVICWALVLAIPVVVPMTILHVDWNLLAPNTLENKVDEVWFSLLYLGLISQLGGFLLWYRALAIDGIAKASQLQLLQPFFTLLFAAVFLHEKLDLLSVAFAIGIVGAVYFSRKMKVR